MGQHEHRFDSDLRWMTDRALDVHDDFELVESAIPLLDVLDFPLSTPSSPFSALFQLDTEDTIYGPSVNAAWDAHTTLASVNGVPDIGKIDVTLDYGSYCRENIFDRDQSFQSQSERYGWLKPEKIICSQETS